MAQYTKVLWLAGLVIVVLNPVACHSQESAAREAAPRQAGSPVSRGANTSIPIVINGDFGTILVEAKVNGRPATLIMDTGSSHTILSTELLDVRLLALDHALPPNKGSGFVGSAALAKANMEVGDKVWRDRRVLVMNDFREISNSIKEKVDGILGEDLLKEFEFVVIDYKHRRLILSQ